MAHHHTHHGKKPEALSRLGSVTDLMSLRSYTMINDHSRHLGRLRHKRFLDLLNVQTRQGVPLQRCLSRLQEEAIRVQDDQIHLTEDESKIFVASLIEAKMRLVLEAELELAAYLYW